MRWVNCHLFTRLLRRQSKLMFFVYKKACRHWFITYFVLQVTKLICSNNNYRRGVCTRTRRQWCLAVNSSSRTPRIKGRSTRGRRMSTRPCTKSRAPKALLRIRLTMLVSIKNSLMYQHTFVIDKIVRPNNYKTLRFIVKTAHNCWTNFHQTTKNTHNIQLTNKKTALKYRASV